MFPPYSLILCGWCTIKADVEFAAPVTVNFGGRVWLAKTSINHGQIWASVCSKRTPEETSAIPLTPAGLRDWCREVHQAQNYPSQMSPGMPGEKPHSSRNRHWSILVPASVHWICQYQPSSIQGTMAIPAGCHWQCCSRQPQSLTTTFGTKWKYRD